MNNPISLRARAGQSGFTLLEVLVAVGAVALVAVGLATIFDSVGKTVSGGRRVSLLTQYAGLIENRLRRDFDTMTRDGVLVIRQQWTDGTNPPGSPSNSVTWSPDGLVMPTGPGNDGVLLHARDESPRPRRIDEIVFFVRDSVRSARQPLSIEAIAESEEARIYYGHGMKAYYDEQSDRDSSSSTYLYPRPDDTNYRPGNPPRFAPLGLNRTDNPNRFASEWTLLRHVTLLVNPESTRQPDFTRPVFDVPTNDVRLRNGNYQIALQPAAASIFRAFNRTGVLLPAIPTGEVIRPNLRSPEVYRPAHIFASGLVDIATSDLNEVRAVVTSMPKGSSIMVAGIPQPIEKPDGHYAWTDPAAPIANTQSGASSRDLAQDWMAQLFPTESNPRPDRMYTINGQPQIVVDPPGARIRYETVAPALLSDAVINATPLSPPNSPATRAMAIRRADQLMLESSVFVARCSEFIVDWSFGVTTLAGEFVWYGPARYADTNNDRQITAADELLTQPYASGHPPIPVYYATQPNTPGGQPGLDAHPVSQRLIHREVMLNGACLTSYFGYTDPTFRADTNGNGVVDAGESIDRSLPWPWPRMVRITMTLSDPIDPSIESTFQFIFNLPDAPAR